MKKHPESSRALDIAECVILGAICVAGAATAIYFSAYFIVNIICW